METTEKLKKSIEYYDELYNTNSYDYNIFITYIQLLKLDIKNYHLIKEIIEDRFEKYMNNTLAVEEKNIYVQLYKNIFFMYADVCLSLGYYSEAQKILLDIKKVHSSANYQLLLHYVETQNYEGFYENVPSNINKFTSAVIVNCEKQRGNYKEALDYSTKNFEGNGKNILSHLELFIKMDDMNNFKIIYDKYKKYLLHFQVLELYNYYEKRISGFFEKYDFDKGYLKVKNKLTRLGLVHPEVHLNQNYDLKNLFYEFENIVKDKNLRPYKSNTKDHYHLTHDDFIGTVMGYPTKHICIITEMNKPSNIIMISPTLSHKLLKVDDVAYKLERVLDTKRNNKFK